MCCHCGCGLLPPQWPVERLYTLRILIGEPLMITSAARCEKHNRKVKGKRGSIHVPFNKRTGISRDWGGGAFDILADKNLQIKIISYALKCGFTGFGLAQKFIHIDDADRPKALTYWTYS